DPGVVVAGKYRIVRWIADGGMGSVYEALNTWTERRVALKVLLPELSGRDDGVRRFFDEARIASRLEHPNIVAVLDMGQDADGTLFIVQEFLDGEDLRAHLDRQPNKRLPTADALTLLMPVMEALEA